MRTVFTPERDPDAVLQDMTNKGDVMGFALLKMMTELERDIGEDGWDQPPVLFLVRRKLLDDEEVATLAAEMGGPTPGTAMGGMVLEAKVMAAGENLGTGGDEITHRLQWLATKVNSIPDGLLDKECFGWALVNEAYMLDAGYANEPGNREVVSNRQIHLHPKRIEIRFILAVDQAGVGYQLMRRRDDDRRCVLWDGNTEAGEVGGQLVDGLRALAEATR